MMSPISPEAAHEVAMTAAHAASQLIANSGMWQGSIGKEVSGAYLQAYEAVEGWTKPPVPEPEVHSAIPHVSLKYGESVNLFNVPEARYMRVTCTKEGWDWDSNVVGGKQPKDA